MSKNKTKKPQHNSNNKMVTKNPENHERATQRHRAGEGRWRELGRTGEEELPHLGTHGAVREGLAFMLLNSQKEEQWVWLKKWVKEIMAEKFPNLVKMTSPQSQEAE